ncbi:MAG: SNF2-related protein [Candidatus Omnitrophota bacterium]
MSLLVLVAFALTGSGIPLRAASAQEMLALPTPGSRLSLSAATAPAILKGLRVYPKDPLRFDFILDKGDAPAADADLKTESNRLIKYFLASLTIPEKDLWVNLSPYEKDRIVPPGFGRTEMARDLLAQDYILKQLTASILYPEGEWGKKFWQEVYAKAYQQFGTTDVPVDTFNKVWITPSKAVVYENAQAGTAYVVESNLKVMLDTDYLAAQSREVPAGGLKDDIAKQVLRAIIIPALEKEVNEGENFARLRQVYQSLILAVWFKKKVTSGILNKIYVDRGKVEGVSVDDPQAARKIWAQYVEAFKKGVYNYIKDENDPVTQEVIPRKYFSGGVDFAAKVSEAMDVVHSVDHAAFGDQPGRYMALSMRARPVDMAQDGEADKGEAARVSNEIDRFLGDPLWEEQETDLSLKSFFTERGAKWGLFPSGLVIGDFNPGIVYARLGKDLKDIVLSRMERSDGVLTRLEFRCVREDGSRGDAVWQRVSAGVWESESSLVRSDIEAKREVVLSRIRAILADEDWQSIEPGLSLKELFSPAALNIASFPPALVIDDFQRDRGSVGVGRHCDDIVLARMERVDGELSRIVFRGVKQDVPGVEAAWVRNADGAWEQEMSAEDKALEQKKAEVVATIKSALVDPVWQVKELSVSLKEAGENSFLLNGSFPYGFSVADFIPDQRSAHAGTALTDLVLVRMERVEGVLVKLVFRGIGDKGNRDATWRRSADGVWEEETIAAEQRSAQMARDQIETLLKDPDWQVNDTEVSVKALVTVGGAFSTAFSIGDFHPGAVQIGVGVRSDDLLLTQMVRTARVLTRLVFRGVRPSGDLEVVWKKGSDGLWAQEDILSEIVAPVNILLGDPAWQTKELAVSLKGVRESAYLKDGTFPSGISIDDFQPGQLAVGVGKKLKDLLLVRMERTGARLSRLVFKGVKEDDTEVLSVWERNAAGEWERERKKKEIVAQINALLADPGWRHKECRISLMAWAGEAVVREGRFPTRFSAGDFVSENQSVGVGKDVEDLVLSGMERTEQGVLDRLEFTAFKEDGTQESAIWNRQRDGVWVKEDKVADQLAQIAQILAQPDWQEKDVELSLGEAWGKSSLYRGRFIKRFKIADFSPGFTRIGVSGGLKDIVLSRMERSGNVLTRLVFKGVHLDGLIVSAAWVRVGEGFWEKEKSPEEKVAEELKTAGQSVLEALLADTGWQIIEPGLSLKHVFGEAYLSRAVFPQIFAVGDFKPGTVAVGLRKNLADIVLTRLERQQGVLSRLIFEGLQEDGTRIMAVWRRGSNGVWEQEQSDAEMESNRKNAQLNEQIKKFIDDPSWQVKEPGLSLKEILGPAALKTGYFRRSLVIGDFDPGNKPLGLGENLLDLFLTRMEREEGLLSRLFFQGVKKDGSLVEVAWRRSADGVWQAELTPEVDLQIKTAAAVSSRIKDLLSDPQWSVQEPGISLGIMMGKASLQQGIFLKSFTIADFNPGKESIGVGTRLTDLVLSRMERVSGVLTRLVFLGIKKSESGVPSAWRRGADGRWEQELNAEDELLKQSRAVALARITEVLADPGWEGKDLDLSLRGVLGKVALLHGKFKRLFSIADFSPDIIAIGTGSIVDLMLVRMERQAGVLSRLMFKGIKKNGVETTVVWRRSSAGVWERERSVEELANEQKVKDILARIASLLADPNWVQKEPDLSLKELAGSEALFKGHFSRDIVIGDFKPGAVSIGNVGVWLKDITLARIERKDGALSRLVFQGLKKDGRVKESVWVRDASGQWGREDNIQEAREKIARAAVEKGISELFGGVWSRELWSSMAARYSLDIRNILWRLAAAQMDDSYDEEQLKAIVDDRIMDMISASIDDKTTELPPVPDSKSADDLFAGSSQDSVRQLANHLQKSFDKITEGRQRKEALLAILRRQAVEFVRKLEEKYFFRQYYAQQGESDPVVKTVAAVRAARDTEPEGILKDALTMILTSMEEKVIPLQQKLKQAGLRATTNLNLYQLVGVDRILDSRKNLEADEMGLGKTLVAIASFLASGEPEMTVLAPGQVLSRWVEDIVDHTDTPIDLVVLNEGLPLDKVAGNPLISVKQLSGKERYGYLNSERDPPSPGHRRIILFNYEGVSVFAGHQLAPIRTGFLVLDEAHFLKRADTRRSQAVFGNGQGVGAAEANFKLVMTGTPLENEVADLFGYLQFLARGGHTPEEEWLASLDVRRFASTFRKTDLAKMSLLHSYLSTHMIRWLKDEVVGGLPKKTPHQVMIDPYGKTMTVDGVSRPLSGDFEVQMALYDEVLRHPGEFEDNYVSLSDKSPDEGPTEQASNESALMLMRMEQISATPAIFGQEGDSAKFAAAGLLIKERIAKGGSTLVFSTYRSATERFLAYLKQEMPEVVVGYSDGDIEQGARSQAVKQFQDKELPVLVTTIGTLGVGQNLTQADAVIFLDKPWKPSTYDQAVDRTHRWDKVRNYLGRVIDIYDLELDIPVSIDKVKARVLRTKRLLSEMIVNGYLSPRIMDTFRDLQQDTIDQMNAEADPRDVKFDEYEGSLMQNFLVRLGQILKVPEAERAASMWDELAELYSGILEHKGSFFANMANLDHLSQGYFPGIKSEAAVPSFKNALDLGSGPSTLLRAYLHKKESLNARGLFLKVTDFDLSPQMLAQGIPRPGEQIAGAFEDIVKVPEASFDLVNMSYAFRYVKDSYRVEFLKNVHRILKDNGLFTVILPANNIVSQRFIDGLKKLGFEPQTGEGARLESRLEESTYDALVKEYGEEFANDMSDEVNAQFTYLVVKKGAAVSAGDVSHDDFDIQKKVRPMDTGKISRLQPRQEERGQDERPSLAVSGLLTYDDGKVVLARDQQMKGPAWKFRNRLNGLRQVVRQLLVEFADRNHPKKVERHTTSIRNRARAFESNVERLTEEQRAVVAQELESDIAGLQEEPGVWEWLKEHESSLVGLLTSFGAMDASQEVGGIDLNMSRSALEVRSDSSGLEFDINEATIRQLQDAAGLEPVILDLVPLNSVEGFLNPAAR